MGRDFILILMERHIDMDFLGLKKELDGLYAVLNEPHSVVPEWTDPGISERDLVVVENRLGVRLPECIRCSSREFSGIYHETPYFLGGHFEKIKEEVFLKSGGELNDNDFRDNLILHEVEALMKWGQEDLKALRDIEDEVISETDSVNLISVECDPAWLKNERFMLIGTTYAASLFINLIDEDDVNYGSLYNSISLHPFYVVYKVANDYGCFLENIRRSLKKVKA
jgi:hypothetical protein